MKNRKWLPLILIGWPYVCAGLLFVLLSNENQFAVIMLLLLILLTAVVYVLNIINACTYKKEGTCQLAFWNMLMKLVHIPFYLVVFIIGAMFFLSMVLPALIFVSPIVVIMLAIIDLCLMITTSLYGINALIRARGNGIITTKFMVVNIIMHLFFVFDVISAVVIFAKIKRTDKKNEIGGN